MPTKTKVEQSASTLALQATFAQINKNFGPSTIIRGDQIKVLKKPRITTGCIAFDVALGGGWTVNSWHEIIGHESSGKTTMILKTIGANQAINPKFRVFWVASEDFNFEWAETCGCDLSRFDFMFDNGMKTVYGVMLEVMASREYDCVVLDSFPALVPEEEEEAEMGEWQVGLGARVNGKFLRKARPAIARSLIDEDRPVTCFFVNQWRDKIGLVFGDPRTTPGGKAKNYEFITRAEMSRDEWITEGEKTRKSKVGVVMKLHTIKNKSAAPEKLALADFYFEANEERIPVGDYDNAKALIAVGRLYGVVDLAGASYKYNDQSWQGAAKFSLALREDLGLQKVLWDDVMAAVGRKSSGIVVAATEDTPKPRRRLNRPKA